MENSQENIEKDSLYSYRQYQEFGGIINEKDYQNVLTRAENMATLDNKSLILQIESIAKVSGIILRNSEAALDKRIILYGILRTSVNAGEKYHHSQMGDQQLFAEALRMLGDKDSLQKLIKAYPNIFPSVQ